MVFDCLYVFLLLVRPKYCSAMFVENRVSNSKAVIRNIVRACVRACTYMFYSATLCKGNCFSYLVEWPAVPIFWIRPFTIMQNKGHFH